MALVVTAVLVAAGHVVTVVAPVTPQSLRHLKAITAAQALTAEALDQEAAAALAVLAQTELRRLAETVVTVQPRQFLVHL